jgi:hypothetical protein
MGIPALKQKIQLQIENADDRFYESFLLFLIII